MLDNGGGRSAREIHPELQRLAVGDVIPATPDGAGGFEVLELEAPRALVLGGLHDRALGRQLPFAGHGPTATGTSPGRSSWSRSMDGAPASRCARGAPSPRASGGGRAGSGRAPHHGSRAAAALAARAEGRLPRDDWRDVADGVRGATRMAWAC